MVHTCEKQIKKDENKVLKLTHVKHLLWMKHKIDRVQSWIKIKK